MYTRCVLGLHYVEFRVKNAEALKSLYSQLGEKWDLSLVLNDRGDTLMTSLLMADCFKFLPPAATWNARSPIAESRASGTDSATDTIVTRSSSLAHG